jgi:hypothetical protein
MSREGSGVKAFAKVADARQELGMGFAFTRVARERERILERVRWRAGWNCRRETLNHFPGTEESL